MSMLTIRKLTPDLKERLRVRAARHGRSMEEEVRQILSVACEDPAAKDRSAYRRLRRHFEDLDDVEPIRSEREPFREVPGFD